MKTIVPVAKERLLAVLLAVLLVALLGCGGCEEPKNAGKPKVRIRQHTDDSEGTIRVEAENHTGDLEAPMTVEEETDENGRTCKFIRVEGGKGKPGYKHPVTGQVYPARYGAAIYEIDVKKAGKYRFWGRKFWEDGCGNSFTLVVNGHSAIFGEDGTYGHWEWITIVGPPYELPVGKVKLEILNREDGVKLDKFILTTDMDLVPQGSE